VAVGEERDSVAGGEAVRSATSEAVGGGGRDAPARAESARALQASSMERGYTAHCSPNVETRAPPPRAPKTALIARVIGRLTVEMERALHDCEEKKKKTSSFARFGTWLCPIRNPAKTERGCNTCFINML
jgi:hypothetical protein